MMMTAQTATDFAKRAPSKAAQERGILPMPPLVYSDEVAAETAPLYELVKHVIPSIEWPFHAPYISAINKLKKERGAVILAHNYQTPEIFHGVADIRGDSLQLAIEAARSDADLIIQCGVHFMAETSKILCPDKTVLIPDSSAGCSLASSITAADVRALRDQYPGVPIITYVNTSADVKAECDICCTSSNAVEIVESLGVDRVLLVPDQYLAKNVAAQTDVEVLTFAGSCEVHERFTADEIRSYRRSMPDVQVIAHPECPPEVVAEADFSGSTKGMIDWVKTNSPEKVMMITECSMADNVASETPDVNFVRPCNLCPHMKKITLPKILDSLLYMQEEVTVDPLVADKARRAVERMINLKS
ncbi:quinolinate synthase NadA [Cohaesibacter marisflavi]|uniref:quinolinate synthase NadA n=1 Tax=Cohaesibacter marisflavi TaxID=655353 RepID=UPI0029C6EACD|nr:quinolinate synthase NadA [Cohaesibacter marisflavi]